MSEIKYSNAIEIELQLFDVQLHFNLQNSEGIAESTTMILSPQHMKVLSKMLESAVGEYEKQFGTIALPAGAKIEGQEKNNVYHFRSTK